MDRRGFIRGAAWATGALGATSLSGCGRSGDGVAGMPPVQTAPRADASSPSGSQQGGKVGSNRTLEGPPGDAHAVVASDNTPAELVKAAVDAYTGGAPEAVIRSGDTVVIKPNLAWGMGPDIGANTSPEVLRAVIQMAQDAGAGEVLVVEHSCESSVICFEMSGAQEVCDAASVRLISLDSEALYEDRAISMGTNITAEQIARDVLECDAYINLPCLKQHEATRMTLAMKNQMGAIFDPQRYHREGKSKERSPNLHQNIADLASALRPTLTIADATRALTSNGPRGPGNVEETRAIIVSHDMVTVDALGTQFLGLGVEDVPYVELAADLGLGSHNLDLLDIVHV